MIMTYEGWGWFAGMILAIGIAFSVMRTASPPRVRVATNRGGANGGGNTTTIGWKDRIREKFKWNAWTIALLILFCMFAGCGSYYALENNRKRDLSDDTKEYIRTAKLPDYMTDAQHVDVYRRTAGSGIIDAPDKTAKVMRVATGNNDPSNPKGVAFGSCSTKFHYRYRWHDTGLWSQEVKECQPMEVVHAPVGALEVEIWMEMTDGTVSNSIVKFLKYRRNRS